MKARYIKDYNKQNVPNNNVPSPSPSTLTADDILGGYIEANNRGYSAYNYDDKGSNRPEQCNHPGKWVLKFPKHNTQFHGMGTPAIDDAWQKINEALAANMLYEAKASPVCVNGKYDDQMIAVYTPNHDNEQEIFETHATLLNIGIPHQYICGYKRNEETVLDDYAEREDPNRQTFDLYIYNSDKSKTKLFNLLEGIKNISSRWLGNDLTQQKNEILKDFHVFFHKLNGQVSFALLREWIIKYQQENSGQNPLQILNSHRRTGLTSIFNPRYTDSIKLIKSMLNEEVEWLKLDGLLAGAISGKILDIGDHQPAHSVLELN